MIITDSPAALASLALALLNATLDDDDFIDAMTLDIDHDIICRIIESATLTPLDADTDALLNSDQFAAAMIAAMRRRAAFLELDRFTAPNNDYGMDA